MERRETTEREFRVENTRWRATVAWRGTDGSTLCYFRPLDGDGDGREDRRARLDPDRELAELDEEILEELLTGGSTLTATERRFRASDGRDWLAQNIGPVWAREDAAEGATGILFTALDGTLERARTGGGHVGQMDGDRLDAAWRRATGWKAEGDEREGDDGSDGGGSGRAV